MREIVLIAHNLRSSLNVGSLLRTADGLGLQGVYLTGYTPYPTTPDDTRLPHIAAKVARRIHKTALGAEESILWQHHVDVLAVFDELRSKGYVIAALEQTQNAVLLPEYQPAKKIALLVGREVEGIEPEVVRACDLALEIPMLGRKESFNVAQAAGMALYHCRYGLE